MVNKSRRLFRERHMSDESLASMHVFDTDEFLLIRPENPFPGDVTFTDSHMTYGGLRSDVAESILPDLKRILLKLYDIKVRDHVVMDRNSMCYHFDHYYELGALKINPQQTYRYIVYGFAEKDAETTNRASIDVYKTQKRKPVIIKDHRLMGYYPITMEMVGGGQGVINNMKRAIDLVCGLELERQTRTAIVKSNTSGSTGVEMIPHLPFYSDLVKKHGRMVDESCAWLSLMAMMRYSDPDGYDLVRQMYDENPGDYINMYIFSKNDAMMLGVKVMNEVLRSTRNGLRYRMSHVLLNKKSSGFKKNWLEWLNDESVKGDFVCHLITETNQSTHAVGLTLYGNGSGMIFDSVTQELNFKCANGFRNFDGIFEDEAIINFEVVGMIEIPMRRKVLSV